MNIVIAVIAALLIGNSSADTYQPFNPDMLNGGRIENVIPSDSFYYLAVVKDGKKYFVVLDGRRETKFVYEVLGTKEKPKVELIWAKDWI